jgi:hypothetical protein
MMYTYVCIAIQEFIRHFSPKSKKLLFLLFNPVVYYCDLLLYVARQCRLVEKLTIFCEINWSLVANIEVGGRDGLRKRAHGACGMRSAVIERGIDCRIGFN